MLLSAQDFVRSIVLNHFLVCYFLQRGDARAVSGADVTAMRSQNADIGKMKTAFACYCGTQKRVQFWIMINEDVGADVDVDLDFVIL